ncbi:DUF6794 domain-containing protein [Methylocaldum sp. RMAD-M]|jgi:hypothetical protein|uniref:DUF6794 domain-containing protein n=1 Tax=unclassified Methylocaldum TaxID=2622260 RepID=UPI000A31E715|nr:DUF6794 domain-containing protein [Methylocaldum sp. RMAD-M]MBP1152644.1 hypothetical protein [Methylocaldum sp. RMAD-M]MVF24547.1 hypothetical protein [Methylocaldum sp. BRCS4]
MTKPSTPTDPAGSGQDWPRTLNEAVDRLARMLSHTEKEEIAALTEGDLIGLHFGPGMRIRNEFSLWHDNSDLLMNCQGIKYGDAADSYLSIDPDDASMMIIRVLWARLRH